MRGTLPGVLPCSNLGFGILSRAYPGQETSQTDPGPVLVGGVGLGIPEQGQTCSKRLSPISL